MSAYAVIWFVLGLTMLVVGAELFVRGASHLGISIGISPLVVGLTVVAYGTSAPELGVSVCSALAGSGDIALGNVVGSNICNVLLVLGLSALLTPLAVSAQLVRWDVPLMIGISLLLFAMAWDGCIGRLDGSMLFIGSLVYTSWTVWQSRREGRRALDADGPEPIPARRSPIRGFVVPSAAVVVGIALLLVGARWVATEAASIARFLGLSELVIGLTIVAVGTSLPEIATSAVAAFRGQRDIAVGNVVGSNLFNILLVLGLAAVVAPNGIRVPTDALRFDIPVMIGVAIMCLPIFVTGGVISRSEGLFFLLYYACYTGYLLFKASEHRAAGSYDALAMVFVVPPVLIGVVMTVRFVVRLTRHTRKSS